MNAVVKDDEGRDWEAEAKKEGWAPIEHWKGNPDDFKSAEQFVKDGEKIPAILKSKIERKDEDIAQLKAQQTELRQTTKQFKDFMDNSLQRERKEKDKLKRELEAVRKQAVTDGDGEAFDRADRQLEELKEAPTQETNGLDPLAQSWLEENSWYASNDTLGAFADGLSERLMAQGYTGKAYFDELTKRTQEAFPDEFGNKNRKKPNAVESTTEPVKSSEQTFDNLPAEAKAAYASFAKDIEGFSKEDYVANYDWE